MGSTHCKHFAVVGWLRSSGKPICVCLGISATTVIAPQLGIYAISAREGTPLSRCILPLRRIKGLPIEFALLFNEFGTPLFQVYCVISAFRPLLSVQLDASNNFRRVVQWKSKGGTG